MEYTFTIPGRLDGLNIYTAANRTNPYAGSRIKRNNESLVIDSIRFQLKRLHIEKPIAIYYHFYEKNKKRDGDNILSCGTKFIQDALVKTGVLDDDNMKHITHFWHDVSVDKENPRIEVTLIELEPTQADMPLEELIRGRCKDGGCEMDKDNNRYV